MASVALSRILCISVLRNLSEVDSRYSFTLILAIVIFRLQASLLEGLCHFNALGYFKLFNAGLKATATLVLL